MKIISLFVLLISLSTTTYADDFNIEPLYCLAYDRDKNTHYISRIFQGDRTIKMRYRERIAQHVNDNYPEATIKDSRQDTGCYSQGKRGIDRLKKIKKEELETIISRGGKAVDVQWQP